MSPEEPIEAGPATPVMSRAGDAVAVTSIAALAVTILVIGRRLWFFSDDWNILAGYHDGNLLTPFNNHLSLLPAGLYKALFHTVGLGSYLPYRLVGVAGMALLGLATWRYSRSRVGSWGAALATTAVIWGSGGMTNLMFPFLVNFSLPIACLLSAWLLLDRDTPRADAGAAGALGVALATSGLGVLVAAAVGIELIVSRAPLRRWAPFAPPVGLWAAWYLTHRVDSGGDHTVGPMISYALRMLRGGATALAAGWRPGGVAVAVLVIVYFGFAGSVWRTLDARTVGALAAPVLFAGLTAFTRLGVVPAIPPDEYRYRWTIAAFVVLAVVSAWPGGQRPLLPAVVNRVAAAVAVAVVAAGAVVVVRDSIRWSDMVEAAAPGLRAELFAAEAVGGRIDPSHVLPLSYVPVTLGGYLDAVDSIGSPLDGHDPADFGGSAEHRKSADSLMARLPARPGEDLPEDCDDRSGAAVTVPAGGTLVVEGTADSEPRVTMTRFGDEPLPVAWVRPIDATWQVRVPADAHRRSGAPPYRLALTGAEGVLICPP